MVGSNEGRGSGGEEPGRKGFSTVVDAPSAGPGGESGDDSRYPSSGLIEVVFGDGLRLGGVELGGLIEVVGEGILGGVFLCRRPGPHVELGLGWSTGRMEERG